MGASKKKQRRILLPIAIGAVCCVLGGLCCLGLLANGQQQAVHQSADESLVVSDAAATDAAQAEALEDGTPIITNASGASYVANQLLLMVDSSVGEGELSQSLEQAGVQVSNVASLCTMASGASTLVEVTYAGGQDPAELSVTLASADIAASVEPNYIAVLADDAAEVASSATQDAQTSQGGQPLAAQLQTTAIDDEYESKLWHLDAINAYDAWDIAKTSGSVTVAVLDSGVDTDHSDLAANLILGDYAYNVVSDISGAEAVEDELGHGTHVAGIISAVANNALGVAGVSYNAKVLPIKITNSTSFSSDNIATAIEYVIELKQTSSAPESIKNIKVISLSCGTTTENTSLEQAVQDAKAAGITVVAAAGNSGTNSLLNPAASSSAVGVGSIAESGDSYTISSFSNYGEGINVVAPGSSIYSTVLSDKYGLMSGTSMATPVVSGTVALLYACNSTLTPDDVLSTLEATATDMGATGWDEYYGSGLINAQAAVEAAASSEPISYTASFDLSDISNPGTALYIDGVKQTMTVSGTTGTVVLSNANAQVATLYTYNKESSDAHEVYPTHMYVWLLEGVSGSDYTVSRQSGFDDVLKYAGASIRLSGNKGIRMITAVPTSVKQSLTGSGYLGWQLEEYGTVIQFDETLAGADVLLTNTKYQNYAYKRDVADPVYVESNGSTKYTNVLVGFSEAQCAKDLSMRPYITLSNTTTGETITMYGGTVHRSIGYVALQNKDAYDESTEAGQYIWGIIRSVYGNIYG